MTLGKYNGVDVTAGKFNGAAISAGKYNGISLLAAAPPPAGDHFDALVALGAAPLVQVSDLAHHVQPFDNDAPRGVLEKVFPADLFTNDCVGRAEA